MKSWLSPHTTSSIVDRSLGEDLGGAVHKTDDNKSRDTWPNNRISRNWCTLVHRAAINNTAHVTCTTTPAVALPSTSLRIQSHNSSSKIPLPSGSQRRQLQLSASAGMRGTKSSWGGNSKMETEHALNDTHTAEGGHGISAHDTSDAGVRISARRKLVLTSPNATSPADLTRSLSLRRYPNKLHDNSKTDNDKETAACSAATAAPRTTEHSGAPVTPGHIKSVDNPSDPDAVDHLSIHHVNEVLEGTMGRKDITDALQEDTSMLLDGKAATAATAPAKRPTTLATSETTRTPETDQPEIGGNENAVPAIALTTVKAQKTSKTPTPTTTAQLAQPSHQAERQFQSHSRSQTLSNHRSCSGRSPSERQAPLYTVPEVATTKLTPCTPPVTPDSPCTFLEDDLDSMYSFATTTSGRSTMSCEHPYVARNGTTFSGRKMKYVVHCSNYAGQVGPDYLTPTQRAARQVRRLKELLCAARQDLEHKDSELLRLTREVVELRLFKASLSSPEERSASSDAVTVREAELKTSQDVSPIVDMVDEASKSSPRHIVGANNLHHHHDHLQHQYQSQHHSSEMQSSFADSGHFEDLTSSSVHSKDDSYAAQMQDIACGSDDAAAFDGGTMPADVDPKADAAEASYELQRQELIRMYEERIEELIRNQDAHASEVKRSHNDKVEALLQKLAECNTRYADIVPDYEHAKERIRELEKHLEELQRKLAEHEDKQNKMYLHMYQQGQEAERIARADQALELAHRAPNNKVSLNELLHQLQSTQDELENIRTIYRRLLEAQKNRTHVDPEITLQFLKSAIYYFLTDKENSQGHLQAIESILEFTEAEKQNINRAK